MSVYHDKEKTYENLLPTAYEQINIVAPESPARRLAIRKLVIGTAALAGCSVLPDKWTIPLVEFGTLPAHATTSGLNTEIENEAEKDTTNNPQAEETVEEKTVQDKEPADDPGNDDMRGYSNELTINNTGDKMSCDKVWQDKFIFSKLGPQYGKLFLIVWSDGNELDVPDSAQMAMNPNQDDFRKYQPGGSYSNNNPDIPTMEVYAKRGTHPDSVTLYY